MNIIVTPQTINETEVNSVNARELWEKLGVKTKYADWIKRRIEDSLFEMSTQIETKVKTIKQKVSSYHKTTIQTH